MRSRSVRWSLLAVASLLLLSTLHAVEQRPSPAAGRQAVDAPAVLAGQVTSQAEGPMEGVLVSARKTGGTVTVTVVTDAQGRYRFPAGRLDAGTHTLSVRAVGYDLDGSGSVALSGTAPANVDLRLVETRNLAAQLTNAEWLASFPGTDEQKASVRYTEYDLPKRTRQPHDVIVDSTGLAWYASFGEQILGRLDPATGKVTEYAVPLLKPSAPTGILGMRFDRDENPWLAMQFQAGIARFDRKTETFQTWKLPPDLDGPHVQLNQVSPEQSHVDGKVWFQDAGTYTVLRLDLRSGQIETFEPYKIPRPNVYDVIPDANNNGYFLVLGAEDVGRIDAATGRISIFKTPTPRSGPRRGMMDPQGRLWFGENAGDRIGMFDTRTERFQEWASPTPGAWPYDVTADRNGEVWSGNEYNDRILRLDPGTSRMIEYLLPRKTNVRRVWVDNRTTPVTFWVGNNHGASIVKLEPLDGPAPDGQRTAR